MVYSDKDIRIIDHSAEPGRRDFCLGSEQKIPFRPAAVQFLNRIIEYMLYSNRLCTTYSKPSHRL